MKKLGFLIIAAVSVSVLAAHADTPAATEAVPLEVFEPVWAGVNLLDQYDQDSDSKAATPAAIDEQNAAVFAALARWQPRPVAGRLDAIGLQTAKQVLTAAMKSDVVGKPALKRYDPLGNIGFCFGRAMWMHLELLKRGVNKDSIFKAFVVGRMFADKINWQFHVATIVRSTEGGFLVLDPEFKKVLPLEVWFKKNKAYSPDKKLRLYVTEPTKFGASAANYNKIALNDDWYNSYFKDVLAYFRSHAGQIEKAESTPPTADPASVSPVPSAAQPDAASAAPVCRDLFSPAI